MVRLQKTKEIINKLPDQKKHLDFLGALLTIPVLITVIMLNLGNLHSKPATTAAPTSTVVVTQSPKKTSIVQQKTNAGGVTSVAVTTAPQPTTDPQACIKGIGPIDVSFPQEGQTVTNNPLCINISYASTNYCGVVWSYQINGGPQSSYANTSVCLYNLPNGNNTFTLQVKSLVSNDTQTIDRHFIYQGNSPTPTPTAIPTSTPAPTASASSSATLH